MKIKLSLVLLGLVCSSLSFAEEVKSINFKGLEYKIITSPITGKKWLDRNLGASQACTSSTDKSCKGDYYQWGRLADGHEKVNATRTSKQTSTITSAGNNFITAKDWTTADADGSQRIALWSKTDGTGVCPVGFRVPTLTELKNETLDSGVINLKTAFSNFLKFPEAYGYRHDSRDSISGVWTSSVGGDYPRYVWFYFNSANWTEGFRTFDFSIRCVEGN